MRQIRIAVQLACISDDGTVVGQPWEIEQAVDMMVKRDSAKSLRSVFSQVNAALLDLSRVSREGKDK